MSLLETVNSDIKVAMKAKDKVALEALRAAKSAFILARTEISADAVLTSDQELKIIQKLVKQRKDSASIYKEQNREDLLAKEESEAAILEKYLPAKFSAEELTEKVSAIIEKLGASSPQDMGKVMGVASKELAGKADGKDIADKVKELLSK